MIKLGIAFTGSFCTTDKVIEVCERLLEQNFDITPIFSEHVQTTDTRFGKANEKVAKINEMCKKCGINTIVSAERIGPEQLFDALVIAPCTGNTLAKLANGITDNTVTMAVKSHLRNEKPLIVALATNDGLSGSAQNIAMMLNRKHCYFVPFGQDNPHEKPNSLVANMDFLPETIQKALKNKQIQPILI
ncbi:MAG: dipicolinate synthase subunit B [Clostridia bacterium]